MQGEQRVRLENESERKKIRTAAYEANYKITNYGHFGLCSQNLSQ
jgi:hypothetical protein